MKSCFIFLISLIFSVATHGQAENPYKKYLTNELKGVREWADPIPIDKGQEEKYFKYAVGLLKQDSLQKAGQIFDRIYWLDTASALGKQAYGYRATIESRISIDSKKALQGVWIQRNCVSDNTANKRAAEQKSKTIVFQDDKIVFYERGKITRTTSYQLSKLFNWVDGFSHNTIKYLDTGEEWYYDMRELDSFVTDNLHITQRSRAENSEIFECYQKSDQQL